MKKDDPCIGVCQWDGRTGWCLGCGRTVPEIRAWRKMTPYRRTALARELPRRIGQVADTSNELAAPRRDKRRGSNAKEPSRRQSTTPSEVHDDDG
ncbi:DUF1289 domain-containing protein [Methylobacterium gregans]|uniref:DUF1289 domain-containing protein n=1 Tax=Methylobacterium gregans TaxID=374424 RepID=A0AA37MBA1_9HYPH|nr:DUF1289 domain-containing protein [Methylobacterium gregans]MDQ0522451.1 putative Fe-S protein YdhL (DUF1289 family) [Methylobacterium gregans]GJD79545.1 hypothetical protein NBEOAGPD_2774 [Methylobacterium gregans]GLS55197.1 DUF1289 domain-containing protein [Methylobacterium gregans]